MGTEQHGLVRHIHHVKRDLSKKEVHLRTKMKRASRVTELKPQCSKCLELHKVEAVHQIGTTVFLVCLTIHLREEVRNARKNNHLCEDCGVQWAEVQWAEAQWGVQ